MASESANLEVVVVTSYDPFCQLTHALHSLCHGAILDVETCAGVFCLVYASYLTLEPLWMITD